MEPGREGMIPVADALAALRDFPEVDLGEIVRSGLVVIAPHPDDESLGCGGLIAACRTAELPVRIVVVSDGAGSHPDSLEFPPERLAAVRRDELLAAAACLGVEEADVQFLDLPDRLVPSRGADADLACEAIVRICEDADAVAVTWRHDPHHDHQASFALAARAMESLPDATLWEYPIWGLTLPGETLIEGPAPEGVKLRVDAHLDAKRRAIKAHASQTTGLIADDPKGFRLTEEMIARFDGPFEVLIRAAPSRAAT